MKTKKATFEGITSTACDYLATTATHTLIGGVQGAGKSTLEAGLINSLMFAPVVPSLILIDPKREDLAQFRPMRNVIRYADTPATAKEALEFACEIIEARNEERQRAILKRQPKPRHRPVYVIIDELADLVLSDKTILQPLQRVLQRGRSSSVRCVCLTQVVCSQVVSPLIRYNFDCYVALRCSTPMASRLLLDQKGAETLPRHGKAIIKDADGVRVVNVPMIPQEQLNALVDFWK